MPQLSNDEYAIVMQSLLHISDYVKSDSEVGKMTRGAIQILKQTVKGTKPTPQGASYISNDEKLKELWQMFGLRVINQ